ncbi:unnamed protein product [Adineta steineri]|uniref:DUF7164 domain-containing protein n=2 Tax=Adineta steineri TaxID=433720 RepID=A0A815JGZ1_9BILA|nr:unnamed protein product [Adineta steineri]CAF1379269.1 unnamed protein product [Adineta steineri]CAF3512304.1 unnamed protein product [Adineta steineri]CAF3797662.1 unnamed protein product [Adineta steineri]
MLILSIIILYTKNFHKSFSQSTVNFGISQIQYNVHKQVSYSQQLTGNKGNNSITKKLPLIYQPSSQSSLLRALLLFYPNDQESDFLPEFRWFYRSWTEMMINESILWRTDLIVYTSEYASIFKDLDCIYNQIRINSEEKPKCRIFPYIRIKSRTTTHAPSSKYQTIDKQRSQTTYQYLRAYEYIDSINTVFEYNASFSMYDFILRTDMDCFLTYNFAYYVPYNYSILVGRGGYSTEFNNKRLKRIARDMNWTYANKNGLGSTWYGPPSMIHHMANYTIQAMIHLVTNEFTTPERERKLGVMLWPEWHFGVLLLYGGHLAINHLITSENLKIAVGDQLLDQGVTSKDKNDISKNLRLHLHCWHGDDPFSKFQFKAGKYNEIDRSTLISDTSPSGYAMRLALESKAMTLQQLKQTLLDIKK